MDGVANDVPVPRIVPPSAELYQFIVPPEQPEAVSVTEPVPHLAPLVTEGDDGGETQLHTVSTSNAPAITHD